MTEREREKERLRGIETERSSKKLHHTRVVHFPALEVLGRAVEGAE